MPPHIPHEGFFVGKIPAQDLFRNEYFVMPMATRFDPSSGDTLFYCHVNYVDDVKEKVKDAYQLTMTDATHASSHVSYGEIGKYKNKRWALAFQEESRFRLLIFPFNPILCNPEEAGTIALNSIRNSVPVPISEYYLKLKQEVLNNIEITLHPNATVSDRVIVEALCSKFAHEATIKPSELTDRVMMK